MTPYLKKEKRKKRERERKKKKEKKKNPVTDTGQAAIWSEGC